MKERFKEKMNLLNKIAEAIVTEDCCMECLLIRISELIYTDTSYDEEIKNELLTIVNHNEMTDRQKLDFISAFINEYN